jgi:hypothetical protein
MPSTLGLQEWIASRAERDDRLYERFGNPLEAAHRGEFVAIGDDGEMILGTDELLVAREATERFGPGNFALRRIGVDAEIRWRSPR